MDVDRVDLGPESRGAGIAALPRGSSRQPPGILYKGSTSKAWRSTAAARPDLAAAVDRQTRSPIRPRLAPPFLVKVSSGVFGAVAAIAATATENKRQDRLRPARAARARSPRISGRPGLTTPKSPLLVDPGGPPSHPCVNLHHSASPLPAPDPQWDRKIALTANPVPRYPIPKASLLKASTHAWMPYA